MKSKEKRNILILIGVGLIIICAIWVCTNLINKKDKETVGNPTQETNNISRGEYTKVEQDGSVVNTSKKLHEDKEESGFSVSNISFGEENGETVLKARITNKTGTDQAAFFGNIVLLDKAGNEIGRIPVSVSATQNGETVEIEAYITESYANAYNFKLEK